MSKKEKNNKITIYLLKKDYIGVNAIREEYRDYESDIYSSDICKTYALNNSVNSPSWLSSFYNSSSKNILTAFPKVVSIYTLEIEGELVSFAVPFGGGKSMLINDCFVEDFGLKILLNSVNDNQFRQMNISDCGKNFKTTTSQLPKLGTIDDFAFDFNIDILKKAVAKCNDEIFAENNIIGGDGITITVPYKCDNLDDFLINCYKIYKSDNYKTNYSWVDNIREVKDSKLKEELEIQIIDHINNRHFDKVWMAVPDSIEWDNVSCFKFRKRDEGENDISIESFIKTFENEQIENYKQICNKSVSAYDANDSEKYTWSANKCLMCEIEYKDNNYCYNSGKWYVVNKDYGKEINDYYKTLKTSTIDFIDYNEKNEKSYNKALCNHLKGSYNMDCNDMEAVESGRSSVELCDVLTSNNELIHVKKAESSSYLSHLFNQARVSSDLLFDKSFRKKANGKIGTEYFKDSFDPKDYTIILGIITKYKNDLPRIPFFSKVAIKYLVQDLRKLGYKLELKNIYNKLKGEK